jgi:hypothetical protein
VSQSRLELGNSRIQLRGDTVWANLRGFSFERERSENKEKSGWGGGLGKDVTLQGMSEHRNISGLEGPHAASARPSGESMLKRG